MSDVTFDRVLELAKQLEPAQRLLLAMKLEESIPDTERGSTLRQALIADHDHLLAGGAFTHTESLYGKFASPGVEWEDGELESYLHEVGTEWELELDELADDDNTTSAKR